MRRRLDLCDILFFLAAGLQAGAVWLHRSFPTQDGPMQLYLADVLEDVMRGSGNYSSYFQPQGYAHPYSFSLYALVLLNQVFRPLTSERVLVSVYFIAFALGVRYLIRSVDAENRWLGLFLLPFAMNAYLCLGIYNFSYGMAVLMFLMGLWLRWSGRWSVVRSIAWLALLMLLGLMHHVPILILGGFAGAHLAGTAMQSLRSGGVGAAWRRVRWDVVNALLMAAPLGWYAVFAVASVKSVPPTVAAVQLTWLDRVRALMQALPLSPYMESGYLVALVTLMVGPVVLLLLRPPGASFAPQRGGISSLALAITAAVCLAVFVFGPHFLFGHGHGYFAERMSVPFVLCALAAVAPLRLPDGIGRIAAVFACCLFLFTLILRERQTAAIVAELAPVYDATPAARGASGAIISGKEGLNEMNFNPFYWAGAIYALHGKGILLNLSGGYEPIALLAVKGGPYPWDDTDSPQRIRQVLYETRVPVSPPIGFLCGGKWDRSQAEMESSATLAQRKGLVRVLDSRIYYCYSAGNGASTASR